MDRLRQLFPKEADKWTLAVKLARSGRYSGWLQIELELRNLGHRRIHSLLDNEAIRERLDQICVQSKKVS
jgi:hypothetical protein